MVLAVPAHVQKKPLETLLVNPLKITLNKAAPGGPRGPSPSPRARPHRPPLPPAAAPGCRHAAPAAARAPAEPHRSRVCKLCIQQQALHDHTLLAPSIEDAWTLCVCQPPDCNPVIWQMKSQVQRQAAHSLRRGLEFASCAGRTFQMPRRLRTADQYSGSGTVPASSCPFMECSSSTSSRRVFPAGCQDNFSICGRRLCMPIEVKLRRWQQLPVDRLLQLQQLPPRLSCRV